MTLYLIKKPLRISPKYINITRLMIHLVSLIYLAWTLYAAITGLLPGDPVQYLLDFTGIGALNLLLLSLSISPISQIFKFVQLIRLRKTFGVYAAVYALSHFGVFIVFELQFEWGLILSEIVKRPYITVGFSSLLILTFLLITSFDFAKSTLKRKWQSLHNWVYLALALACLHFLWSIKSTEIDALIYFAMGSVVLLVRKDKLLKHFKQTQSKS